MEVFSQRHRIVARTLAAVPGREIPDPPANDEPVDDDTGTSSAKVIPLGLFDPLQSGTDVAIGPLWPFRPGRPVPRRPQVRA